MNKIKGCEEKIWEALKESPKVLLYNMKNAVMDPNYEENLIIRAKEAKLSYLANQKVRRDLMRTDGCSRKAETFNVMSGNLS